MLSPPNRITASSVPSERLWVHLVLPGIVIGYGAFSAVFIYYFVARDLWPFSILVMASILSGSCLWYRASLLETWRRLRHGPAAVEFDRTGVHLRRGQQREHYPWSAVEHVERVGEKSQANPIRPLIYVHVEDVADIYLEDDTAGSNYARLVEWMSTAGTESDA